MKIPWVFGPMGYGPMTSLWTLEFDLLQVYGSVDSVIKCTYEVTLVSSLGFINCLGSLDWTSIFLSFFIFLILQFYDTCFVNCRINSEQGDFLLSVYLFNLHFLQGFNSFCGLLVRSVKLSITTASIVLLRFRACNGFTADKPPSIALIRLEFVLHLLQKKKRVCYSDLGVVIHLQ